MQLFTVLALGTITTVHAAAVVPVAARQAPAVTAPPLPIVARQTPAPAPPSPASTARQYVGCGEMAL